MARKITQLSPSLTPTLGMCEYLLLEGNRDEERKRAFAVSQSVSVSSAFGSSLAYFDTPVRRVRRPVHSYFPPSLHCICPYPGRTLVRAARPFVPARSLSIRILRDEERWAKVGRSTDERRGGNSLPSFSPSFGPLRPSVRPSVRPSDSCVFPIEFVTTCEYPQVAIAPQLPPPFARVHPSVVCHPRGPIS